MNRFLSTAVVASVLVLLCLAFQQASADDKNTISGSYKANGKEATLKYITARHKKEEGKEYIVIIFSEKDQSKEKNAEMKAAFGDLGDALIITARKDGHVSGCVVSHSAMKRPGLNSLGEAKIKDFKVTDGKVTGNLTTDGEVKAFNETWQADLKFSCELAK